MNDETEQHVGEKLSGYMDGELTQQQRQRVELHCAACAECRHLLEELTSLKQRVAAGKLSVFGEDKWRENMTDQAVKTSRSAGWIVFLAGLLFAGAAGLYVFIGDTSIPLWTKLILVAIYGGLALLLYSVLRQRLTEQKTDKYKDVEI